MKTKFLAFALLICALTFGQTVTVLSGTQKPTIVNMNGGYNNGIGSEATYIGPTTIATTKEGISIVVDMQIPVTRKVLANGVTTEDAGNHDKSPTTFQYTGWGYADGFSTNVRINTPMGACSDASGNIYFADTFNNRIRKRLTTGEYITIAGSGLSGSLDGQGTAASFNKPQGVYVDASGNIYVADSGNKRIRKISSSGLVSTVTSTITGFKCPNSISIDANGNIYICDIGNYNIKKVTSDGTITVIASGVTPNGIIRDSKGNFFFTDASSKKVKKITNDAVSDWAGGTFRDGRVTRNVFEEPYGISIDAQDNLYVANRGNQWINKISPN